MKQLKATKGSKSIAIRYFASAMRSAGTDTTKIKRIEQAVTKAGFRLKAFYKFYNNGTIQE